MMDSTSNWLKLFRTLLCCLSLISVVKVQAADDFLEPERAFQFSARMTGPDRVELSFTIAKGYYLYRERFQFNADGAALGPVQLPVGKVKFDENFQKNVETYRDGLQVAVPVISSTGVFELRVVSQGCADAGLCYPPMTSSVRLNPAVYAATATGPKHASTASEDSLIDGALRSGHFWRVVGAFFAMGVLLSLTPCVLPMLPILSSIIVGSAQRPTRSRGLVLASSYSFGMALVYTALGVAAGLAGEGLASSLQTPWALTAFSLLLVAFALSMFGVYELRLPARLASSVSDTSQRLPGGRLFGVFIMGAISALIVSPCVSAPLAGALLYISQSRDTLLGGAALFSMACGMSTPLLLFGASSGRWLPKTGPWMHAVKRLFGALMLGLAIWTIQPVLPATIILGLWGMLLLLLGFMLKPFSNQTHHHHELRIWLQRALGVASLTLGVLQIVGAASGGRDPLQPLAHLGTGTQGDASTKLLFRPVDSVGELEALLGHAGRPVVLDFYADWCVSCKEMERFTFANSEIAERMSRALLLKADVTANDAHARELLKRFKLFGPPGTIFFDGSGSEILGTRVIGFQSAKRFGESLTAAGL